MMASCAEMWWCIQFFFWVSILWYQKFDQLFTSQNSLDLQFKCYILLFNSRWWNYCHLQCSQPFCWLTFLISSVWLMTMTLHGLFQIFSWLSLLISVTLHSSGNEMTTYLVLERPSDSVSIFLTLLCSSGMIYWFSVDQFDSPLWYWNDLVIQYWYTWPSSVVVVQN